MIGRTNTQIPTTRIYRNDLGSFTPVTGTFSAGPNMIEGRRMHSATLLADGRVLIAGGFNGGVALSSAELYDPSTETFSRTGAMVVGRGWHDAILLPAGTVLIVGGSAGFWPDIPGAEIFNPATGAFGRTGEYVGRGACDFRHLWPPQAGSDPRPRRSSAPIHAGPDRRPVRSRQRAAAVTSRSRLA